MSFFLSPPTLPSIIFTPSYSLCVAIFTFVPPCNLLQFFFLHSIHLSASRATSTFSGFTFQLCAPASTFTFMDHFHLRGNNPLTASFTQMTSSNPSIAVGSINPLHSPLILLWRYKSGWFKEEEGTRLLCYRSFRGKKEHQE